MDSEEIFLTIAEKVAEVTGACEPDEVQTTDLLENYCLDDVLMADLMKEMSEAFEVKIEDFEMEMCDTVGDLCEMIEEKFDTLEDEIES